MIADRTPATGWILAGVLTSALLILASLPPFVGEEVRRVIMVAFSGVCHQISSRSPHLDGIQLAVCDRCVGIYAALAAGTVLYRLARRWDDAIDGRAALLLILSVLVPGIDWFGDVVGLWMNTPLSRMVTGGVFGLAAGYFFARAMVRLFVRDQGRSSRPSPGIVAAPAEGSK